jgi:hypothetical protein
MKKIVIAGLLAAASTAAFAGGFDGPFAQLGIGGSSTKTNLSNFQSSATGAGVSSVSGGSFNGLVAGGYSQDMGAFNSSVKGLNLAANIFYVIGNQNSGSGTGTATRASDGYTQTLGGNVKLQNTFGIFVEPGWNFTDETLGYVKLGWLNSRLKGSWNYSDNDPSSDSGSTTKAINGFGYGLGVKQLITKQIFVGVDLIGVTYGSADLGDGASAKSSQFMGFASIGYKF